MKKSQIVLNEWGKFEAKYGRTVSNVSLTGNGSLSTSFFKLVVV